MTHRRQGSRTAGLVAAVVACATAVTWLVAAQAPAPAAAADLTAFEPGLIMSDSIFFDSTTMTAAQVQTFLAAKGSSCVATSGNTCLKNYAETTPTRAADSYCSTYRGATNEKASSIIAKVAVACGINPQVLIVTLQKEQGLVTATAGKPAATYAKALGFGCPDSAACNPSYAGFANQVYSAARQFQLYTKNPGNYTYQVGMTNNILYNPNRACGTKAVFIQNQATANLYDYTPYTPNAAALAAGYGTGDSCSSYGNRNFWNYFTDWFGSTTQRDPFGHLDSATASSPTAITVTGWALDPDTTSPVTVHAYVDGKLATQFSAANPRSDVGRIYGKGDDHGFSQTISAGAGTHEVCLYVINIPAGSNPHLPCATVTVTNHAPTGHLDVATAGDSTVRVTGWALDPDTTSPVTVHAYVDGKLATTFAATGSRPDVGAAFGKGNNHGFDQTFAVAAGTHQVCLYAINIPNGSNPRFGCATLTVANHAPVGHLDAVTPTSASTITVAGWALDPDTTNPIAVHVYIDGRLATAFTAANPRSDIASLFGKGPNHGFSTVVTTTAGTHQVCTYAIDTTGGPNPRFGCTTVAVGNQAPIGSLDYANRVSPTSIQVIGWALDPDTTNPIAVHVYIDGRLATAFTAANPRSDIASLFGKGPNHGFSTAVTTTAGTHQVCTYAIDTTGGPNPRFGCKTVTG